MNDTIKRYFELKGRNDNRPFVQVLNFAYQNGKITDDDALLFCNNNWKKMHGFKMRRTEKMSYRGKGKGRKKFVWDDKVNSVIFTLILTSNVKQEYVNENRVGTGLGKKDVGSNAWEWTFFSDILNCFNDGHI